MLKISVFTGSRSDFDRLYWVCKAIDAHPQCRYQLIVANAHFSPEFGMTVEQVRKSGLKISSEVKMLLSSSSRSSIAKSLGVGIGKLTDALIKLKPDCVLVLGDRTELLSVVTAALCLNIPIAHIGGGQVTEGAVDDQVRNMVTKAAHLHFVANKDFAKRVVSMGEEPWRVFATGSPSIDSVVRMKKISRGELSRQLGLDLAKPTALVVYHPTTMEPGSQSRHNDEFFSAVNSLDMQLLLTYPNSDHGSKEIIKKLKQLERSHKKKALLVPNLGSLKYLSAMQYVKVMIGNSSSGVIEAPVFNLPVVDVGTRQKGRPMAKSIFNVTFDRHKIVKSIHKALAYHGKRSVSPWGDGHSSRRIVHALVDVFRSKPLDAIMRKRSYAES